MIKNKNGNFERFDVVHSMVGGSIILNDDVFTYNDGQIPPTEAEIDAEVIRLQAEWDAQDYARNRKEEYPPMEDQLDYMYHNGFEKWKTDMIDPVKDKYPKG